MAVAPKRVFEMMEGDKKAEDLGEQGHEAAIERLREIAEHGLGDPALDGVDDIDQETVTAASMARRPATVVVAEVRAQLRIVEALLFAAPQPLSEKKIAEQLPEDTDVSELVAQLAAEYSERGVQLVRVAGKWAFRTADDLAYLLEKYATQERRLSKAALETMAIIAYHQPVTRAEIEEVRGVQTSRGTLDVLMETGWIRPRGRRRAPGKPVTYGTTDEFLSHFGLEGLGDLPGLGELKGAGLLDSDLPPGFAVPNPKDVAALMPDELPLEDDIDETEANELDLAADEQAPDEVRPEPVNSGAEDPDGSDPARS
jgi:segregation and condensation protein B